MAFRHIKPLFDRVLVERIQPVTKTASGLYLPETSAKRMNEGTVLAVGNGARTPKGDVLKMTLKEGDRVLLPEFGANSIKIQDKEVFLFREEDILAVVQEK
eukprot:EC715675.1.p1 GENE.EC715675.1~~EC715675.1.p1  ORF type:complete len:101 (+),score=20.12 EC715675.1:39-341(+)